MASLAATLLCYFDEDTAFVMLVRMWQLRGLERLYQPGFSGLMEVLGDFETNWLSRSPVAEKLVRDTRTRTSGPSRTLETCHVLLPSHLPTQVTLRHSGHADSLTST